MINCNECLPSIEVSLDTIAKYAEGLFILGMIALIFILFFTALKTFTK